MMKEMSFIMTELAEVRNLEKSFPFSPAADAATPTSIAKTINASMLFLDNRSRKSGTEKARTIWSPALRC